MRDINEMMANKISYGERFLLVIAIDSMSMGLELGSYGMEKINDNLEAICKMYDLEMDDLLEWIACFAPEFVRDVKK